MHTSMPECVILVFSHRQQPKPSYKPRSWCYFSLWPGVMKLWCRQTSQPFLSAFGSSQSSPQLQTDNDGCCPQSILTSKCKQIVKGQNKRAEDHFSLIETAEKIPGNSGDTCQHHYSRPRENALMHTHTRTTSNLSQEAILCYPWTPCLSLCGTGYMKVTVSPR